MMSLMTKHTVQKARAKINLTLDILGKRLDGYHEVAMVMQSVDLADDVALTMRNDGQIRLTVTGNDRLPTDEKNLAYKAARLFFAALYNLPGERRIRHENDALREKSAANVAENWGADIAITKRIPMAAGLAGGSADAAAVLTGLNKLFDNRFADEELCRLGEKIGSDIPFCIIGGTMLATGRGEILTRLAKVPPFYVVLAKPLVDVSTAWAYAAYDAQPAVLHPDNAAMQAAIAAGDEKKIGGLLCNVLESVTIKRHPVIADYKKMLVGCGMQAALMSGSGPTVFAVTDDEATAQKAAEFMRQNTDAEVVVTTTAH